ncbi:hypothetical protein PENTCL1PPCAC_5733, partial [Pristionchus entomophagus]
AFPLLLAVALCNIIDESQEYGAIEDPYEFTSPYEMIDMGIDDLCDKYPSLRPSSDEEMITFKKEFMLFLAEKPDVQDEVLTGFPSNYRVLWGKMKELRKIADEEFDALTKDDQRFIESPTGLMLHKLAVQSGLKVIALRKADFKKRKLSKDQIKDEVNERQLAIFQSWYGQETVDEDSIEDFRDEL